MRKLKVSNKNYFLTKKILKLLDGEEWSCQEISNEFNVIRSRVYLILRVLHQDSFVVRRDCIPIFRRPIHLYKLAEGIEVDKL